MTLIVGLGEVLWDVYPNDAHLGGAPANFACYVAELGDESWMVSAVGSDDFGSRAMKLLSAQRVCCDHIAKDSRHGTGRVLVKLDRHGRPTYEFASDPAWDHLHWSPGLEALAKRCDAVCFGTLAQRSPASRATIRNFLKHTRDSALRMFDVNLRQRFYDRVTIRKSLEYATAIKLNEEELPIVAKLCDIKARAPETVLEELVKQYDLRVAALTCGPAGAVLVSGDEVSRAPAERVRVTDTVGAGDAFTATLVHDFLLGIPLNDTNRHANAVAAYVCTQPGATARLSKELLTADAR
jgi:fructokinase